jgi:hypothetical protein
LRHQYHAKRAIIHEESVSPLGIIKGIRRLSNNEVLVEGIVNGKVVRITRLGREDESLSNLREVKRHGVKSYRLIMFFKMMLPSGHNLQSPRIIPTESFGLTCLSREPVASYKNLLGWKGQYSA